MKPAAAVLLLPLLGATVYYGTVTGAKKPAQIEAQKVFDQIPEYQEIKRRNLKESDSEYWVLLEKANQKFYNAVSRVAQDKGFDVIVEKGSEKFETEPPDVTQDVIGALTQ